MKTIVFAGAGSIAEAMIGGIVEQGSIKPENIFVMNRSNRDKLINLKNKYGVSIVCPEKKALAKADLIILAMKPIDIENGMENLLPYLAKETAILSVMAGVSIQTIEKGLGARPIARAMPNTSAAIGKSATAVAWNEAMNDDMKKLVLDLLEAIGIVREVEEYRLHTVTALSGSGPAYFYYLAEALEEAAIDRGLSKDTARALIIQTFEGAAAMLKDTGEEPAQLRKNITSPGGTTEAGLVVLEARAFKDIVAECFAEAEKRAVDLGKPSKSIIPGHK